MIEEVVHKTGGSVRLVCETLGVARSSFYHATQETATQAADAGVGALCARAAVRGAVLNVRTNSSGLEDGTADSGAGT